MFLILLVPVALGASPNDACFAGGCHNSTSTKSIDHALYDSNPHKIIKCINCHTNSTNNSDLDHGHFIRQLNGSTVSGPGSNTGGPLLTSYSSQSFALCYVCHNETKLIGVLPDWPNNLPDDYHNLPPTIVSSIGTNFINIREAGKLNDIYWPANIHWDHLDAFGVINTGKFDYNNSGSRNSFQTCPTCHNVHGTNYPKMTKNDLAITYDTDSNGSFGYTGSLNFKISGGDLYCDGICHSSIEKYYRNEINLFEDCVSCHIDNVDNIDNISLVNKTAFSQGVHVNISRIGGDGIVNNSDCWTCHFEKDMDRSNISKCEDCHTGSGKPAAPAATKITSHLTAKTNYSCVYCHSKVIEEPGTGIINITSHYLKRPLITTPNYCDYCHGPNQSSPFNATNKTIPEFKHDDPSWNGISTCRTCHTNSSVSADPKANDTSSFHNLTTELGDAINGSTKADCILCHIQKDPRFVSAPGLPLSHPILSGSGIGECYGCHGSGPGSQPQKLHSVEPTGGGCIGCHSNEATRYNVNTSLFGNHKNVNTSDGDSVNVTDSDCKTCHYGSFPMVLGAANSSNTRYCNFCHSTTAPIVASISHGATDCKWCHAAGDQPNYRYHSTTSGAPQGPRGTATGQNCVTCHYSANLPDLPFHAPGEAHSDVIDGEHGCSECHYPNADNHAVSALNDYISPTVSVSVSTPVLSGTPTLVQATIFDGYMQIAAAQYRVTNSSGEIIPWTNMTPSGGRFGSNYLGVYSNIATSGMKGTYTVYVKGMASAYKTNPALPYYPLNGKWSSVSATKLTVIQAQGYDNGSVYGTLGAKLAGVIVSTDTGVSTTTNGTGFYSLSLVNGTYHLTASKEPEYYANSSVSVTVTAFTTVTQDIILTAKPKGNITGIVRNK
jgi:hypothetical protein